MSTSNPAEQPSPWRRLFEQVRGVAGHQRDGDGVRGSINWIRKQMERRSANPNVVRNIIYRDKGRLSDKRVLFDILAELWWERTNTHLKAPEIEVLLARTESTENEVQQLLGREKRSAYLAFVAGVRSGDNPKLLITGQPGSGKTLLLDYIQEALESSPRATERITRVEFGSGHLNAGISRLLTGVGVPSDTVESKLAKVASSGAFSVQADSQAELARTLLDTVRAAREAVVLLAHVSRPSGPDERLGNVPLRLNTPEIPRVTAAEWLWHSVFEPLSRLPNVCLLLSMTDLPARARLDASGFGEPVRLRPPTAAEARRFVRARLPRLEPAEQESIVRLAGRSFEELRTLTLLSEVRAPLVADEGSAGEPAGSSQGNLVRLSALVCTAADERLKDFLSALAVLSPAEFTNFTEAALRAVRDVKEELNSLERSFLDPVPPASEQWRAFSREFGRLLREKMARSAPERFRELNLRAAEYYRAAAESEPCGEAAGRWLRHLQQAREWLVLTDWLERYPVQQSLIGPLWAAASSLPASDPVSERLALQVASHYVRLGSYDHPHAREAFDALAASTSADNRAWALIQRAEGAVLRGQVDRAEELLAECPEPDDDLRTAEVALVRANVLRWRSRLDEAAWMIESVARPKLVGAHERGRAGRIALTKAAVWAGLIAKDKGELESALAELTRVSADDGLIEARVAFQKGNVLFAMGRFDAALASLDRSVLLAGGNQAPVTEQARYLVRRGRLRRKRLELAGAQGDLAAARELLESRRDCCGELECSYQLALCDEERALALAAEGGFDTAIGLLENCIREYERYAWANDVDGKYRILRCALRLALAYLARGLGQAYRLPLTRSIDELRTGADVEHARSLQAMVRQALLERAGGRLHWALRRRCRLVASLLAADPAEARAEADCALAESRVPFLAAESLAYVAWARLRAADNEGGLHCVARAEEALAPLIGPEERCDVGLRAWLAGLGVQARLRQGDLEAALGRLASSLADPSLASGHETLLRTFGEEFELTGLSLDRQSSALGHALGFDGKQLSARVRLPDALVLAWAASSGSREGTVK
jgi:tetratricopeptide (TPR) repeat protein